MVLAVVIAGCIEGTSSSRFGELRIQAAFSAGEDPSAMGVQVDSTAVRVTREATGALVIDTVLGPGAERLDHGWIVDLESPEEPLEVELSLRGQSGDLYAGTASATVVAGDLASGTITMVPVTYVGPPPADSVSVTPTSGALASLGDTLHFSAQAFDAAGTPLVGRSFAWSSSDPAVATVDPASGIATAVGNGSAQITAASGTASASATLTVAQVVTSVSVTPNPASLAAVGATQQFSAVASDAGGSPVPGTSFTWTTSDPAVATIDAATGLATAAGHGKATIRATAGAASGTAALDVNLTGAVTTVTVLPASASLTQVGATAQFTAEVRDGNGTILAGVPVSWSSSAPQVATVDPVTGLATATGHGSASITAVAGGASGAATVNVTLTAQVATVTVLPGTATLTSLGATQQFTAEVRDANAALLPGVPVTWSSSAPGAATIDPSTGLATAAGHGTVTITATASGGASGTATLIVDLSATATTVTVLPPTATLTGLGATQQFTAEVRDANGTLLPGAPVSWNSSDASVATIDPATGLATATGHGTATITASTGGTSGTALLDVDLTGTVTTVTVLPGSAVLTSVGATQQFIAEARDAGGTLLPGVPVTWTSSATTVAIVDPTTGLATATGHGATTITASASGSSGTAALDVNFITQVASVAVIPASASLTSLGGTQQFTAVARDGSGNLLPGVPVTWQSSNQLVATIDPATGLATSTGHGTATITATAAGASDTATLDVNLAGVVTTVTVSPANVTLAVAGETQQFTAEVRDGTGALLSGVPVVWSSSAPLVATIDPVTGLATAAGLGNATITATAGGVAGTALLTVTGR